jgi:uncharacterized protein YndB with AHSA1/START domain
MKSLLTCSRLIQAPVERVYAIIADYRDGHARILPRDAFLNVTVEQGGYGAGTVVSFQMQVMGGRRSFRAEVSEPQPGRVLVETNVGADSVTTFHVEPKNGGQATWVTITTELDVPDGIFGRLQGWLSGRYLQPIYEQELKLLAGVAGGEAG